MKSFVKTSLRFVLLTLIVLSLHTSFYAGVMQQQERQPGPGKKFVTTPFGPIEVDLSDPRQGIAFGPPLQPEPQAPPAAVQPQPAPAQQPAQPAPAQAQADQSVNVQLNFNNADLHQVVRLIGNILGINYVIDPTVRGSVNMNTAG